MAWATAPFKPNGADFTITRQDKYGDLVWYLDCPSEFVAEHWVKAGRAMPSFNGLSPLTWQEIKAYIELTGAQLESWQAEAIRCMSQAYCAWLKLSENWQQEPPIQPDEETTAGFIEVNNEEVRKQRANRKKAG